MYITIKMFLAACLFGTTAVAPVDTISIAEQPEAITATDGVASDDALEAVAISVAPIPTQSAQLADIRLIRWALDRLARFRQIYDHAGRAGKGGPGGPDLQVVMGRDVIGSNLNRVTIAARFQRANGNWLANRPVELWWVPARINGQVLGPAVRMQDLATSTAVPGAATNGRGVARFRWLQRTGVLFQNSGFLEFRVRSNNGGVIQVRSELVGLQTF